MFSAAKMAVCKVPANDMEALKSSLMSLFEKKRVINMYKFINGFDPNDSSTWAGMDLNSVPMSEVYSHFNLGENTIDFLGHAVAMEYSDTYLYEPAINTIPKM